jgi:hypothetical protein
MPNTVRLTALDFSLNRMFGTIRRHQSWIWPLVAGVVIVTFLISFNPTTRMGNVGRGREGAHGVINNKTITEEEYDNAKRMFAMSFVLRNVKPQMDSAEAKYEIFKLLFLLSKQEQLGIHITDAAAAELARHVLGNTSYDDFVDKHLRSAGLTGDDFDRFLRFEIGNEQMQTLAGMSGTLVTPAEAEALYRDEHRDIDTKLVWFPVSNYLSAVTVTSNALAQFYTEEKANYLVPDQVQVNYVSFPASNYVAATTAAITNLNDVVEKDYEVLGTNTFTDAKTPEEIKAKIKQEIIQRESLLHAQREAAGFAEELETLGNHSEDLEKLAKQKGIKVHTTAPFSEDAGPADLKVSEDFAKAAFQLTTNAPIQASLVGEDAVYVISLKDKIPSRMPEWKEVESKVTADYREMQAHQLAEQAANKLGGALTNELNVNNGVTLAKGFSEICTEAGDKAETLPPFSLSTTNLPADIEDRIDLQMLKRAGFGTAVGSATPVVNVRGGSFILYVDKIHPVDETKVKEGVTQYLAMLRRAREADAFNAWINHEIQSDPQAIKQFQQLIDDMQKSQGAASSP